MKNLVKILLVYLISFLSTPIFAMSGGGGGGPSLSNTFPGPSVTCGTASLSIGNGGSQAPCYSQYDADAGEGAYDDGGCVGVPNGGEVYYEDCMFSKNNGGLCFYDDCSCWGTHEFTEYMQFCPTTTQTYDISVTAINCGNTTQSLTGSLQIQIMSGTSTNNSICDLNVVTCNSGFTADRTFSLNMSSGECYTFMFDGNAGSPCDFDMDIECPIPLGVNMGNYESRLIDNETKVEVAWSLKNEFQVDYYEIYRSQDGTNFESIAYIPAKNLGENETHYQYVDESPRNGINYYQLIQTENDGNLFEYGKLSANVKNETFGIYPNPISNDLNISFGHNLNSGNKIAVYDILGNLVYQKELNERASSLKVDMNDAKKGMYFLFIESENGIIQQKFYKD